jgi:site-specific DNA-methyltransferase (adenine-specific)
MKTIHRIISGDSRQMSELKDKSVHLIVTSPPYWQLKDYGTENQIGFHDDYETCINHLMNGRIGILRMFLQKPIPLGI